MKRFMIAWMLIVAIILSTVPCAFATEGNDWESEIDVVAVAVANGKTYPTVQEAVNAANGAVVTLLADSDEKVTATADLYLDLNGCTLEKLTMTAGTLYGMDNTTDKYNNADNCGKITVVEGSYAANHKSDIAGDTKRYMAIQEESGVSFHRFYLGITKVNLAPASTGFGYKAEFYGDAKVQAQVQNIGYSLWITQSKKVTRTSEVFKNLLTLRLQNYDVANYGEIPVHANVFMTLENGTVIESSEAAYSMRQIVETVAGIFDSFDATQQNAVKDMCKAYEAAMTGWNITNILN